MSLIQKIDWVSSSPDLSLQELVTGAGLRPECDFRGCDFRDVDFDGFTAPLVDLTQCDLRGAKLDGIRGEVIVAGAKIDDRTVLPRPKNIGEQSRASRLDELRRFINNFHIPTYVPERVVDNIQEERLVYGGFNSSVEQEITSLEIEKLVRTGLSQDSPQWYGTTIVKFESHQLTQVSRRRTAEECDALFEDIYRTDFRALASTVLHTSGLNILTPPNDSGVVTVNPDFRSLVRNMNYSDLGFGRHIADTIRDAADREGFSDSVLVIFSGYPPISERLWKQIRKNAGRARFVILCPTSILAPIATERLRRSNLNFAKGPIIAPYNTLSSADVVNFLKRLSKFELQGIYCSDTTAEKILNCAKRPVSHLRAMMSDLIQDKTFLDFEVIHI